MLGEMVANTVVVLLTSPVLFTVRLSKRPVEHLDKIVLAFSLSGLPEMSLIALSLNHNVAFVVTNHLFRVILIITLTTLPFKFFTTAISSMTENHFKEV